MRLATFGLMALVVGALFLHSAHALNVQYECKCSPSLQQSNVSKLQIYVMGDRVRIAKVDLNGNRKLLDPWHKTTILTESRGKASALGFETDALDNKTTYRIMIRKNPDYLETGKYKDYKGFLIDIENHEQSDLKCKLM